jgi:hypothetical protein
VRHENVEHGYQRFQRSSIQIDGKWVMMVTARCSYRGCGYQDRIRDTVQVQGELAVAKFRQRGWRIGSSPAADLCPKCAKMGRKAKPPKEKKFMATAEQPRQPTIPERRQIMEELEVHYDVAAERYMAAFSDESIASKLNVPRAWVSDIRTQLFGLHGGNETELKVAADLEGLEKRVDDALTMLAEISADIGRLKTGKPLKAKPA